MKKCLMAIALMLTVSTSILAGDFNGFVDEIYVENETQFRVKLSTNTNWLYVKESIVGATRFDKIHAQLLAALINGKYVWIGTEGRGYDIWGTTIYR